MLESDRITQFDFRKREGRRGKGLIFQTQINFIFFFRRQRLLARKRDGKERNKLKRQIEKVEKEGKKEKYKKSCQSLRKHSDSPQSKVNQLTANPQIKKTLLYHQPLIQDISNKCKHATKDRERQLIAKVTAGRIAKITGWIFK